MRAFEANQFVLSIALKKDKIERYDTYPFCLPIIKSLKEIKLHPAVTFIVGENGSGKSTLLEAWPFHWDLTRKAVPKTLTLIPALHIRPYMNTCAWQKA